MKTLTALVFLVCTCALAAPIQQNPVTTNSAAQVDAYIKTVAANLDGLTVSNGLTLAGGSSDEPLAEIKARINATNIFGDYSSLGLGPIVVSEEGNVSATSFAGTVGASNISGVLPSGTVAANSMTAGSVLGTDGVNRIWTNAISGTYTATYGTNTVVDANGNGISMGMRGTNATVNVVGGNIFGNASGVNINLAGRTIGFNVNASGVAGSGANALTLGTDGVGYFPFGVHSPNFGAFKSLTSTNGILAGTNGGFAVDQSGNVTGAGNVSITNTVTKFEAGSANTLVVTNGRVGIGTTAPGYPLEVNGTIRGTLASLSGSVQAGTYVGANGNRWVVPNDGTNYWTKTDGTTVLMSLGNGSLYIPTNAYVGGNLTVGGTFSAGLLSADVLNADALISRTNAMAGVVVDFSRSSWFTNAAGNFEISGCSGFDATNEFSSAVYVLAAGSDISVTVPSAWFGPSVYWVTNGYLGKLNVVVSGKQFTNCTFELHEP